MMPVVAQRTGAGGVSTALLGCQSGQIFRILSIRRSALGRTSWKTEGQ
jgi:hypothetical protein